MQIKKAKVITITSVKGGTGKSTVLLNMAGLFSQRNLKTIIIDLDLSSGVISSSLNIPSSSDIYTLVDDMANGRYDKIEKYVKTYKDNLDIIPSSNDPRNSLKIHPSYIEGIIKQLQFKYDIILIDTNHVISSINITAFDNSDEIIYIMTDDLMDLKNMKTMIAILDDLNSSKYKIVLNESLNRNIDKYEIKTVLDRNIDYTISKAFYNPDIQKIIYDGKLMSMEKKNNKSMTTLNKIIDDILNS